MGTERTDRELIELVLTRAEVPYECKPDGKFPELTTLTLSPEWRNDNRGKVKGYAMFYAEMIFDGDGHLTEVGIWE